MEEKIIGQNDIMPIIGVIKKHYDVIMALISELKDSISLDSLQALGLLTKSDLSQIEEISARINESLGNNQTHVSTTRVVEIDSDNEGISGSRNNRAITFDLSDFYTADTAGMLQTLIINSSGARLKVNINIDSSSDQYVLGTTVGGAFSNTTQLSVSCVSGGVFLLTIYKDTSGKLYAKTSAA